ncbi:hypothetical protein TrRE_jg6656 [Triparma retinervis]|uniref:Uncharacterized protein n=1 Tax=Triparma retinervis TaxID=2557542 RepID=A0A9W7E6Z4_9STRA|nr:hypothetical protein TrRE_jg6656 [Triparma retinervis]
MGNISSSDLSTDKTCVGAYRYNPCWFCGESGALNKIFCCGRPVWTEGAGFALVLNDAVPIKTKEYPEWEKGTTLRNDFEKAILGNQMREVLLEAEKDSVGAMRVDKLAPHLNKLFCPEVNALLVQHGFRCEAKYWLTFPRFGESRPMDGTSHFEVRSGSSLKDGGTEHFALAIFKIDSADSVGDGSPFLSDQPKFLNFLPLTLKLQHRLAQVALDAGRRNLGDSVDPTSEGDGVVGVAVGSAGGVLGN